MPLPSSHRLDPLKLGSPMDPLLHVLNSAKFFKLDEFLVGTLGVPVNGGQLHQAGDFHIILVDVDPGDHDVGVVLQGFGQLLKLGSKFLAFFVARDLH